MGTKMLLMVALGGAACGYGREREAGVPPSTVSDSAILARTAKRDVVDLETFGRTGESLAELAGSVPAIGRTLPTFPPRLLPRQTDAFALRKL